MCGVCLWFSYKGDNRGTPGLGRCHDYRSGVHWTNAKQIRPCDEHTRANAGSRDRARSYLATLYPIRKRR